MSLTWVICGSGRRVGKTTLALALCKLLPNAVYAKQGCGPRQTGKPPNLFRTDQELAAFLAAARTRHEHLVVESNKLARRGDGDVIVYLEGALNEAACRPDADLLRAQSHVRLTGDVPLASWRAALQKTVPSATLRDAVCELLARFATRARTSGTEMCRVTPLRFTGASGRPVPDPGEVAVEELVTVMIPDVGNFALLCTPGDLENLALGFAYSEGLIETLDDVHECSVQAEPRCVVLRLADPPAGTVRRNLIMTSSCGLCGSRNIDRLLAGEQRCGDEFRVTLPTLHAVVAEMRTRQRLFAQTGGTHAAGVFTTTGELLALAEDLGRHNALDKALGRCLRQGVATAGHAAVLSGRTSVELVAKAARAGLELIAAVSAPSSLAIQVAQRCNITLCGFVRDERATVYASPQRIIATESESDRGVSTATSQA